MRIEKFHIYLADLNPRRGTEPGKIRPVVVIQTDLLNNIHPSTIVCPITTKLTKDSKILRIHLPKESGLAHPSDILVDQIRAIDNRRFQKHIGKLNSAQKDHLLENLKILLFE
jgi:mRNA interferase MazF